MTKSPRPSRCLTRSVPSTNILQPTSNIRLHSHGHFPLGNLTPLRRIPYPAISGRGAAAISSTVALPMNFGYRVKGAGANSRRNRHGKFDPRRLGGQANTCPLSSVFRKDGWSAIGIEDTPAISPRLFLSRCAPSKKRFMNVFELTRALVDIESITGNEENVGLFLFDYLNGLASQYHGRVERMEVEPQ